MGTMTPFAAAGLEMAKMVAGQQQANKAVQAQADQVSAQNAYLTQQQQIRAKQQRDLMARQLAVTRARLSAGGIGAGAGSGQALLSGMVKDSEGQLADADALMQTRQANSTLGLGSGDGLLQGLNTVEKGWSILRKLPIGGND